MKIAIFASAFHPSLGGVEELVRQLAHAHRRAGHDAIVITERWPRDLPHFESYEGLSVYRFPFRVASQARRLSVRVRSLISQRLTGAAIENRIAAVLKREKIELIHVQCVSSNSIYACSAARRLNLPLVVTLQGELTMDAAQIFQKWPQARQMMRDALQDANAITGCSAQTVAEAQQFFGSPFGPRARVVYNGIRLADFTAPGAYDHPRPYILGIGRHVPQKGFDVLLRAYAQMRGTLSQDLKAPSGMPDLILAGDGALHGDLRQLSNQLGLSDHVHFAGRVDRAQAVLLFKGCDFFVLPSRHEPMGIVNLEAMAAGKAVVASRVGGVPELVEDGQNGFLVPPDDASFLARVLGCLVGDKALAKRLGECGAARVQNFDWDAIAAQYLQIYREVCGPHTAPLVETSPQKSVGETP